MLREVREGEPLRFRCRVGHSFSNESMDETQSEAVERALRAGLRALEERAALSRRLASNARDRDLDALAEPYEKRIRQLEEHSRSFAKSF
jgi:two-component system, chemotaxis family, protein-glutamate methylesterase/glutaminase